MTNMIKVRGGPKARVHIANPRLWADDGVTITLCATRVKDAVCLPEADVTCTWCATKTNLLDQVPA